tara:strand:- start:1873 stop:2862 length:990 start_codon:yes stop_codon:yes gene_type:complete
MISFYPFLQTLTQEPKLQPWLETLPSLLAQWRQDARHGNLPKWEKVLKKLPSTDSVNIDLKDGVRVGQRHELPEHELKKLENLLQVLHPWRKGPYQIHGIDLNTEWRSDWKWDRLLPHISPLKNRLILDVGCGNGYHMWRMLGEKARRVVGVDPSSLFLCQFELVKQLTQSHPPIDLIPLGIEQLPPLESFDSVFSMGVLYHRRSPIEHILQLKQHLRAGGELILETLVVEGNEHTVFVPPERYAKMNNVWFLPSAKALKTWLEKCGFCDVRIINVNKTELDEQRQTEWMRNESLEAFLDPHDKHRTIEGHPAPIRATLIAKKSETKSA